MIIDVKAKDTVNGGSYATDRESEAFKIFEGDPKRFDSLSLEISKKKKVTHYSFLLSFKEENLTKDDLLKYYYQFKEKAFANYNQDELEILAIAHFDDNKPHIHCNVISSSQIDNRDLRLYRGYVDFSRIEAIQEIINYENDLESPFDNMNLLSLTPGQKKRDWKVKKREVKPYKILDDEVYEHIENLLKDPLMVSYKDFINRIEKRFGDTKVLKPKELAIDGNFNNSRLLKECQLVLTKHLTSEGNNLVYNSKLFDESWFNKNINYIKENIFNRDLKSIKFKLEKKDYKKQQTVLKETTLKHEEHIYSRKIGKKYLNENKNILLFKKIADINDIRVNKKNKDEFEDLIENTLSNLNKDEIVDFNNNFKISKVELKNENGVGYLKFTKNNIDFNIYNKNLVNLFNNGSSLENIDSMINKLKSFENFKSNKEKKEFTILLEDVFYSKKISKKEDFIDLLNTIDVAFEKIGQDSKKGNFILLKDKNNNKIRVYNDVFYNFLLNENDISKYKTNRDIQINSNLKDKLLNNYIRSVYVDMHKNEEVINTVKDYQLFKSDNLINTYFSFKNDDLKLNEDVNDLSFFTNYRKNEKVSYEKGIFKVHKTLDKKETGKNIADMYFTRGAKDIKIHKGMDQEILEAFKDRLNEKKYDIRLWDENNKLFYVNPFAEETKPKEPFSDNDIKDIAKETYKSVKEHNYDNLYEYVLEFDKLDMTTKKDIDEFRKLISHLKEHNKNSLEAVCLTSGIDILRVGHDTVKGDYATFEFKGKKVAIYDKNIVDLVEKSNSKEVLLSI